MVLVWFALVNPDSYFGGGISLLGTGILRCAQRREAWFVGLFLKPQTHSSADESEP